MSFKAKVVVTLRYGASILLALIIQWFLYRELRRRHAPAWSYLIMAVGNGALLLIPIDWLTGMTLPRWLFLSVVGFGIAYEITSGFGLLMYWLVKKKVQREQKLADASHRELASADRVSEPDKRAFLAGGAAAGLALIFSGQSLYEGLARPRVVRRRLKLKGLEGSLHIVHVTDFHTGYFMSPDTLRYMSKKILELEPDLVFLTGDQLHNTHRPFLEDLQAGLRPIAHTHPHVYAVAGNHDHRLGIKDMYRALEQIGIHSLHNENITVNTPAGMISVLGVDDIMYSGDLRTAMRGWRNDLPTILLSHRPEIFDEAARFGIGLTLSGHTHGGQFNIAGLAPSLLETRYTYGVYRLGEGHLLHVSCGVGTTGVPMRFGTTPEIVEIILEG